MNDLATSVSGDLFLRLDKDMENDSRKSLEKYRHMSFVRKEYEAYKTFEAFKRAKSLRTFLAASIGTNESWPKFYLSNKILVDLLPELSLLRVLYLSNYEISEVPESIGKLKHLRYLNLSQTKITNLPENVSNLCNLQTLILFGCHELIKLPNSFIKLKNLRHFDLRDTPLLNKIPSGIGELKSLQTLSKIIIGDDNGFEITELKELKDLSGKISINGLDKVQNEIHARDMNILQKGFSELELEWSDVFDSSRNETLELNVLNELKPCNDSLKQLIIGSYGGTKFPNWVGDPSFHRLKQVVIHSCKKCKYLPPLGSLKSLFLHGMDGVRYVGLELLGSSVAFRSLEIMSFANMQGWKEWSINNSGDVNMFPCLKKLSIDNCPHLDVISIEALPSLSNLEITACGNGVLRSLVQAASLVKELNIESIAGLTDEVWRGVIKHLGKVEELTINSCNEIRYLWESQSKASKDLLNLRNLTLWNCEKLVSLGVKEEEDNGTMMTSLRMLTIYGCKSMKCCICPNSSIETLYIYNCDSMTGFSFPKGEGGWQNLRTLWIMGCCKLLEKEFRGGHNSLLDYVFISDWVNLKSIIDLNCYLHLTSLLIRNCSSLESHQLSNLTSLTELEIFGCPSMDASFPSRGGLVWPPNLQRLKIGRLKKPISEWGPQDFPTSLINLILHGDGSAEKDVTDFSQLLGFFPSSLTDLRIWEFKKLERISVGLQHLTSIQYFQIYDCPKVMELPEMLLPQLLSLEIVKSPKLKERCRRSGRGYWPRISHIPKIEIKDDF